MSKTVYPPCIDFQPPERQHFDSFSAFVEAAVASPVWATCRPGHRLDRPESAYSEFCGGSWEDAKEWALYGWPEGAREASEQSARIVDRAINATSLSESLGIGSDVVGACYDVGAYSAGVPECWIKPEMQLVKRAIHIGVNIGASGGIPASTLRRRGIALASLVLALTAKGYPVTVTVGTVHDYGASSLWGGRNSAKEYVSVRVIDASTGSQLDIDRLVFAMAHPTMLRRFDRALSGGNRWNSSSACTDDHPTDDEYDLFIGGTHLTQAERWQDGGEQWVLDEYNRQTSK